MTGGTSISNSQCGRNGGTIYLDDSSKLTMEGGEITDSYSGNDGGAIYIDDKSTFEITDNGAISQGKSKNDGGAIYVNQKASCSLTSSTISENHAGNCGGGIFLNNNAILSMTDTTVTTSSADVDGGGIYFANAGTFTLNGITVSDCYAAENGGGIVIKEKHLYLTLTSSSANPWVISNCSAGNNGGGIYTYETYSALTLIGGDITRCHADHHGGGIYLNIYETATLKDRCTISDSFAGANGGGIFVNSLVMMMTSSLSAKATDGGQLSLSNNCLIQNCSVIDSKDNQSGCGGGIYNRFETKIDNSIIDGCSARYGGGIFLADGGQLTMDSSSSISNCRAYSNYPISELPSVPQGGAIYANGGESDYLSDVIMPCPITANIHNTAFVNNSGYLTGGVSFMPVAGGTLTMDECTFYGNSAETDFGGLSVGAFAWWSGCIVYTVTDTKFTSNTAGNDGGAVGIFMSGSTSNGGTFEDCEFNENQGINGGAVYIENVYNQETIFDSSKKKNVPKDKYALIKEMVLRNNKENNFLSPHYIVEPTELLPQNPQTLNIKSCNGFTNNIATGDGGAIFMQESYENEECRMNMATHTINIFKNTYFTGNKAGGIGGVYRLNTSADFNQDKLFVVHVTDSVILNNHADYYAVFSTPVLPTIGGTMIVNGNTNGVNLANNIVVPSLALLYLEKDLSSSSNIGITTVNKPTEMFPVTFLKYGIDEGPYFFSDSDEYVVDTYLATNPTGSPLIDTSGPYQIMLVRTDGDPVASVTHGQIVTEYYKLSNAIAAARDGDLITLLRDVNENAVFDKGSGSYIFNLAGYTLQALTTSDPVITVNRGTTVTIRDTGGSGKITGSGSSGMYVESGATVTLESGTISGNMAKVGGGIRNNGVLTVAGGVITGNSADYYGGGIFDIGTLTVTGGQITNNIAPKAGGIYYGSASVPHNTTSFTLGGTPLIAQNVDTTSNASNVYLSNPQTFRITCTAGLNPTKLIGVSTALVPPQYVTNGASTDFSASFTSDDTRYSIMDDLSGSDHYVLIYAPVPVVQANWTVSFDTLGIGEAPASQIVANNTNATRPSPDPEESGYRFNNWCTSSDGTGPVYDFTAPVTEDTVLFANWTKRWLVGFEMQSIGTTPAGYPIQVDNGTVVSQPSPDPTANGYIFNGWYYDSACTNAVTFPVTILADTLFYANWTAVYTVKFETFAIGTSVAPQSVNDGGLATRPSPEPDGLPEYVFDDWYASQSFASEDLFNFSTPIEDNTVVYAHWLPVTFTVMFDTNSTTSLVANQTILYGGLVTEPVNVTKEGAVLIGWYNGSTQWNFAADKVYANFTLNASWLEYDRHFPITIEDEDNCKIYAPETGMSGTTINITIRADTGSKLMNLWVNKTNSTPVVPVAVSYDAQNITWHASFTMPRDEVFLSAYASDLTFNVTYDPNGGTVSPENASVGYGELVLEPAAERDGYALSGWKNGTVDWDFATDKVYSDLTLTASWDKQIDYTWYNVILNPDDYGALYASATLAQQNDLVQLAVRAQDGYIVSDLLINGTQPAGITRSADNKVWNVTYSMPSHDINVTSVTVENNHTVTFNSDGGTPTPASQTVYDGEYVRDPGSVTKSGYILTGWKNGTVDWNFVTDKVYSDLTLTANWTAKGTDTWYTVTNASIGNGTVIASTKQAKSGDTVLIGIRALSGHKVTALTVENATMGTVTVQNLSKFNGDTIWTGNFTMPASDVTVTGTTVAQTYTVTFNATGGTAIPENETVAYGEYVSKPYAKKTNAVLVGWKNGTADWNFAADKVYSDLELKANWTEYSPDPWYTVELLASENTTLYSSHTTANKSASVNITAVADAGAVITGLAVTGVTSGTQQSTTVVKSADNTTWKATFIMPAEDVNVSCSADLQTYTVTFNATGGTVVPTSETVLYGGYVPQPSAEKAGADLAGWKNGTVDWNFATDKVYSDLELKANWTDSPSLSYYNITTETVNGGVIYAQEKLAKSGDTVHVNFTASENYNLATFAVRYLNGTDVVTPSVSGTSYSGTFTMPAADVVLNGTTTQVNFTVIARILGNIGYGNFTVDKSLATTGETVNFTASPYGAYIVENNSVTINDVPKTLTSLGGHAGYATYSVANKNVLGTVSFKRGIYTVTVDNKDTTARLVTNRSSAEANETVRIVSVPGAGRNVSMFYVTNVLTGTVTNVSPIHSPLNLFFAANFTMPEADVIVSADYVEKNISGAYIITKDSTGSGTVIVSSQGIPNATKMILAIPSSGYWTDSIVVTKTGGSDVAVKHAVKNIYGFTMPASDVHVSVKFTTTQPTQSTSSSSRQSGSTLILSEEMCEVKFVMNGHGTQVVSQHVSLGNTVDEPYPAPTADGYIFNGWYADPGLTTKYVFSTPVTDNINLYASWTATSDAPVAKSSTQSSQATQATPAPFLGILAGLGAAALVCTRLRR